MKTRPHPCLAFLVSSLGLLQGGSAWAASNSEEQSLTELRNTVVNLLQALVDRGVITREQAQGMVQAAQAKAQADAAAKAAEQKAQEQADQGAVRVPYVPQIVKDEIRKELVAELGPQVTKEVAAQATSADAVSAALPDWMRRMRWTADVRVRAEGDDFAKDNLANTYLDFQAINNAGGISKAGLGALLNTTEDRDRLRLRVRFGFDADLGSGWLAAMRVATGTGETYVSTNQTLGTYGGRYQVALDQGFIRWTGDSSTGRQVFSMTGGRFGNPWLSTDLIWYNDLTWEGLASNYRVNLSSDNSARKDLFATVGAFPLRDVTPSSQDKWLFGGQLGADFHTQGQSRLRFAATYYDYDKIVGQRNTLDSTLLDYTAPQLLQKGNTLFNIRNSSDPTQGLYALASDFRIVELIAIADWHVFSGYSVSLTAEALKNIGFKRAEVSARTGFDVAPRTRGYRADLGFGSFTLGEPGTWRAAIGYRHLERDAVLDAFNDQDFHLGGTDTKGYIVGFDLAFNPRVWARLRYMGADAIDGPPLGVDVWQVDINTQF